MKILIVEDENLQRQALVSIIEKNFTDIIVYQSETFEDAVNKVEKKEISLFFIDVNLNGKSGLELAEKIRSYDKYKLTGIVFVTGEIIHIIEAFKKVHCYDFILKPYREKEIIEIIKIFKNNLTLRSQRKDRYSYFDLDSNLSIKIYHNDIVFIEYQERSCKIQTISGQYNVKGIALSKLLKKLDDNSIIKTHKSFGVNINYIHKIEKEYAKLWTIYFKDVSGQALLSYNYREEFLRRLE